MGTTILVILIIAAIVASKKEDERHLPEQEQHILDEVLNELKAYPLDSSIVIQRNKRRSEFVNITTYLPNPMTRTQRVESYRLFTRHAREQIKAMGWKVNRWKSGVHATKPVKIERLSRMARLPA